MTPRAPLPPLPAPEDWTGRLDLRRVGSEWVGPCPVCGGTDRFHVRRGQRGAVVGCRGCIDGEPEAGRREAFTRILREVFPERFEAPPPAPGGVRGPERPATAFSRPRAVGRYPPNRPESPRGGGGPHDADARRKDARRVWDSTKPLAGTLAAVYLHARGAGHVTRAPALRFHPALSHPALSHPGAPGRFPCLVARVQDGRGGFLGVQRTYLAADGGGKADVEPTRASLGSLAGGTVRLAEPEPGRALLVGEGIETTAAAMALFELPGWAALGTSGLRKVNLPGDVREVVIAADRDAAGGGQLAAADLAERLEGEGRKVEIQLPPFVGDWNDVLLLARTAP